MKPDIRKFIVLSILGMVLMGTCQPTHGVTPTNTPNSATPETIPTSRPSLTPTRIFTPTRSLPCSPEYCIQASDFPFARPILPTDNDKVDETYRYGYTQDDIREPHHGVEFNNAVGTPVHAATDGTVLYAGTDSSEVFGLYPNFYGNLVILQHELPGFETPVYTLYGHLSAIEVKTGDTVSQGDVIGEVGLTGSAIGAHLHFEVRLGEPTYDHTANPELFFTPLPDIEKGVPTGILTGRIENQFGAPLRIPITIQPILEDGSLGAAVFPELYGTGVPASPQWNENFLVSGLRPGSYRVAFVNYSKVFERTVEVIPGGVTFVKIQATP